MLSTVTHYWNVSAHSTRNTKLLVTKLPAGAAVQVRCKGKGCFTATHNVSIRAGHADVHRWLRTRHLRSGAYVEVRITAPNMVGKVMRFKIRSHRLPLAQRLCSAAGGDRGHALLKRVAAVIALLVAVGGVAFALLRKDDSAEKSKAAVAAFTAAWTRGDDARAGALTDAPAAAAKALKANRSGLDGAKVTVTPGPLTVKDDQATGRLTVTWQIPAIGRYSYAAPVTAIKGKDAWIVHYSPRTIHPRLTATTRLGTDAASPHRADILDRDGNPLVSDRAVVRVGLEHDKVKADSAERLAKALDIDAAPLQKALDGAGPKQFVEAQTLRKSGLREARPAEDPRAADGRRHRAARAHARTSPAPCSAASPTARANGASRRSSTRASRARRRGAS